MQEPIVLTNGDKFVKKTGLSEIEVRGMKHYLDEYLREYYYDGDPDINVDSDTYFQTAYSDNQLNCCGEAELPNGPAGPVSHFFLTENHLIIAVLYIGDDETEVFVRMN